MYSMNVHRLHILERLWECLSTSEDLEKKAISSTCHYEISVNKDKFLVFEENTLIPVYRFQEIDRTEVYSCLAVLSSQAKLREWDTRLGPSSAYNLGNNQSKSAAESSRFVLELFIGDEQDYNAHINVLSCFAFCYRHRYYNRSISA
ncbi:uncharacterized protein LOC111243629 [Varroa destructor]|uniref:Uncharacterized protein n=1 Tax=Varroa destructor TaxID=109461 RepID=A0A7M7M963_VARDE|nr:uncharacterized protein LOC111243629 [Varroa destructor]XP_022645185.1 uncharacterized protein LOC111243629 [Varroa destructor]XP_022645186.1 uncharacterized protein LOC111243629 [Varroa destructor]XP_022645187.1 uncharacterized protein LOC111243629 [Varroa destructor]